MTLSDQSVCKIKLIASFDLFHSEIRHKALEENKISKMSNPSSTEVQSPASCKQQLQILFTHFEGLLRTLTKKFEIEKTVMSTKCSKFNFIFSFLLSFFRIMMIIVNYYRQYFTW